MNRRRFLVSSSVALGTVVGLAGCLEGNPVPPPRKSDVFKKIAWENGAIRTRFMADPRVQSRADFGNDQKMAEDIQDRSVDDFSVHDLAPVGVASAKGRGRGKGAGGRGQGKHSSAPKGRHGRAKWHGGTYDEWWEDHEDEVEWYPATITAAGIGYLGTTDEYAENPPGAGTVEWEKRWASPDRTVQYDTGNPGWYRVGARLLATEPDYSFGWEAVDFKLKDDGSTMTVTKEWKISPRL